MPRPRCLLQRHNSRLMYVATLFIHSFLASLSLALFRECAASTTPPFQTYPGRSSDVQSTSYLDYRLDDVYVQPPHRLLLVDHAYVQEQSLLMASRPNKVLSARHQIPIEKVGSTLTLADGIEATRVEKTSLTTAQGRLASDGSNNTLIKQNEKKKLPTEYSNKKSERVLPMLPKHVGESADEPTQAMTGVRVHPSPGR